MEDESVTNMPDQPTNHLEPRVAKLEAGLDILTRNVTDLTTAVRENSASMEDKLERLTIAVTQAQAPKKTDWSTIFAGVMLVLAIGSAVFWPLNQTSQDNKIRLEQYHESMVSHQKLDNHSVGAALVQRLEEQLKTHVENNQREFKAHVESDTKELAAHAAQAIRDHADMKSLFKEEVDTIFKFNEIKHQLLEQKIATLKEKDETFLEKLFGRVIILEDARIRQYEKDTEELTQWRFKAMGLSSPDSVVPLIKRDDVLKK